jgi:uncharacterized cupredoxin-like copper-binding protein
MKHLVIAMMSAALTLAAMSGHTHGTGEHGGKTQKGKPPAVEEKTFGRAGDERKINRTIDISMSDQMRYDPSEIRVRKGETVRLVVANKGQVLHEIVLGTMADLREHAELMRKFPNMEHDEPHMAHVKPGGKEGLVWQFTKKGEFHFACLIPGHFEAGMVGKVIVAAR